MSDFDLIVLGGGPAGYIAAIRAAQLGAKVALIEKEALGGTCLNRGCIPTKALVACINLYEKLQAAENFGISAANFSLDFKKVIERKDKIVQKLVKGIEFLLRKNNVEVISAVGKVLDPKKIEVKSSDETRILNSKKIILATGSFPIQLPGVEFDQKKFFCSDDLLEYHSLPEKLNIVGGGVIGIHFATIYSSLGCEVTIYEALAEILPGVDQEIAAILKRVLLRKRIKIITNYHFDPTQTSDKTLICIGRAPNLSGIENLNLKMKGRSIWVNEKMETSIPGVFAAGDLVSDKMFAHVAYEQGVIAAENALGNNRTFNYE
ncbi:MAG: dihydrolipoyl dehydrogenase family protein, partial [Candidatus Margulisiibacteriota bacterium]